MRNKRAIGVFIYAMSLPVPAAADGMGDMFSIMFRMMLTMMNIMAESMNSSNSWNSPLNSYGQGMSGWPLMSGMSGMSSWPLMNGMSGLGGWPGTGVWPGGGSGNTPWSLPMAGNPWASPLTGNPFVGTGYGLPGGRNAYRGASLLDGRWYGTSGEILEVRGNRFRLRDSVASLTGTLDIDDNVVKMYTPQTGAVNIYQFVRNETELALQEPGGARLLFYRRPYRVGSPLHVF